MKHQLAFVGVLSLLGATVLSLSSAIAARQAKQEAVPGQASTAPMTPRISQKPEDAHRLFVDAFNAGNLDALVALYEPDAITFNKESQAVKGTAQIREALAGFLAMQPHITLTTRDVLRSGELAMLRSSWEMTFPGPDGKPVQMAHRGAEVVRLQKDGRWLYVIDNPFGGD